MDRTIGENKIAPSSAYSSPYIPCPSKVSILIFIEMSILIKPFDIPI